MILKKLTTVEMPAIKKFVAKDHFVKGNKMVDFDYINDNFKDNFIDVVEKDIPQATLAVSTLQEYTRGKEIMDELGEQKTILLAHLWELLKKQPKGEDGVLLTNGYANIFYIKGKKGKFWAVACYWYSGLHSWDLCAFPVARQDEWGEGRRTISQDYPSDTESSKTVSSDSQTLDTLERIENKLDVLLAEHSNQIKIIESVISKNTFPDGCIDMQADELLKQIKGKIKEGKEE
jgi:hypothetical protein